ncbi:MAG: hypothetical protein AB7K09_00555 [Planctomycetota bacterium]
MPATPIVPRLAGSALALMLGVAAIIGCAAESSYIGSGTLEGGPIGGPDPVQHQNPATPGANNALPPANSDTTPTNANATTVTSEMTPAVEARVRSLVKFLTLTKDDDPQQVEAARAAEIALAEMGPVILPLLESLLTAENALRITAVNIRIRRDYPDGAPPPAANNAPVPADNAGTTSNSGSAGSNTGGTLGFNSNRPTNANANVPAGVAQPVTPVSEDEFVRNLMNLNMPRESDSDSIAVGRFIWRKLKEMEELARKLDYAGAIRIGEAVLTLVPGSTYARQIRSRVEEFELRRLQLTLLDGRVVALKKEVPWGTPLVFRLTLRNVSRKRLQVTLSDVEYRSHVTEDIYTSPVVLRIKFTQWADANTPVASTRSEVLEAGGDFSLGPGEVWSMDWALNTTDGVDGSQVRSIGEYEVSAQIRPLRVSSVDGQEAIRMIECPPAVARVLPRGYEQARENPMVALTNAFRLRDSVAAVLAAGAAREQRGEQRTRVVAWLMEQLPTTPRDTRQLVFQCLRASTGLQLGLDDRHWTLWYDANKDKPDLGLQPDDADRGR